MATQHIPAWKKLGLKLKQQQTERTHSGEFLKPAEQRIDHDDQTSGFTARRDSPRPKGTTHKRKFENSPEQHPDGITRDHDSKRHKSVTFAESTKPPVETSTTIGQPTQPTKPVTPTPKREPGISKKRSPTDNSNGDHGHSMQSPYLAYLEQYSSDRGEWKFNKNKQGALLKHAFDIDRIPPDHGEALGSYVEGLQGANSRERLQTTAIEIIESTDPPAAEENDDDVSVANEARIRDRWRIDALRDQLTATRRRLREAQSTAEKQSPEAQSRLRRRERAEQILLALAQSGLQLPSPAPSTDAAPTATVAHQQHIRFGDEEDATRPGREGTQKQSRKPRASKVRTGVPDDDSSSDSDDSLPDKIAEGEVDLDTDSDSSEPSSSEVSSESDTTDGSSSEASSEESEVDAEPESANGVRLNKQVVRDLIHKQNGAYKASRPTSTNNPPAPTGKARKSRPFDASKFSRPL